MGKRVGEVERKKRRKNGRKQGKGIKDADRESEKGKLVQNSEKKW